MKAREDFKKTKRARMGVWQAIELLNTLVDESDPDVRLLAIKFLRSILADSIHAVIPQTSLSQIEHLLQTAEAIRRDGKPEWMQGRVPRFI